MLRILIADDHTIVRRGLKQILLDEFPDTLVMEAADGTELLKKAQAEKPDIVFTDVTMPGISGIDVLKQLKEEFPELPVLVLSMHSEDQYALRVLRAGAAGYITKESAPDELIKAVRQILAGKRYITASVADKLAENLDQDSHKTLHEALSDREFDVFKLIASGKTVSEIGDLFSLSVTTVSTYRARVLQKLRLHNNAELVRYAIENNLV